MPNLSRFSQELRRKQNLSLKKTAALIHADHRRLSRFEKGFDTLTLGEVENLAQLGKRDLVELLCIDPETGITRPPSRLREKLLNVILPELLQDDSLPPDVRVRLPQIFRKLASGSLK